MPLLASPIERIFIEIRLLFTYIDSCRLRVVTGSLRYCFYKNKSVVRNKEIENVIVF